MNQLIQTGGAAALTMSSQEIAELVEKRHDNVKRTIETLANQKVIEFPQIEEIPTATKPTSVYVFSGERGKRDSIIVVAQLSPEFTARLVDRWQELETQQGQPAALIPQTLPDALRLAAEAIEERDRLALENQAKAQALAIAAPKAQALDLIATADGSLCLRDAAKTLQRRPIDLQRWLQAHGWIYRRAGNANWLGYQDKTQLGYLEHKVTVVSRDDGSEKIVEQVRITPKGLSKIAQAIRDDLALMAA